MYEFDKFVETRDYIKSFRKDAITFLSEQESAFLNTLSDEEVRELVEAWYNPADWARAGLRGVGQLGRGISNIPSHIRAGYHGIDTTATGGVNTQDFKNQLAAKQYGVDPTQYNGKKGFDQAAFDKAVQDKQVSQMDPAQQRQYYQTQTAGVQDQIGVQKAKNDLQAAQQGAQPKAPQANVKTIMAGLSKIKGMTPQMAKSIAAALNGMGIK
jgi:hypothetical protein